MKPIRRATSALLILSCSAFAPRLTAQGSLPVSWTEMTVPSAKLGGDRKIFIVTPGSYDSTTRFPVLVLLDADDRPQFDAAVANLRFLGSRRTIRPMILVGIPNGSTRTFDLTPQTTDSIFGPGPRGSGGADRFADFLIDEVLPAVRARYRTTPYTVLAGHSLGGLFVLHTVANRPGAFSAGIAMSPSLWWSDSTLIAPYATAIARAKTPFRLFLTSGGFEPAIDGPTRTFAAQLDALRSSTLTHEHRRHPADGHTETPLGSLTEGLRFIFEPLSLATGPLALLPPSADSASIINALRQVEVRYSNGARTIGVDTTLPELFVRQIGQNTLSGYRQPGAATVIFRRLVELRPQSPIAHDNLGDALLASRDTAAARAQYRAALSLAEQQHDALEKPIAEKLKRIAVP